MSYRLGLSILQNNGKNQKNNLKEESKRILSIFENRQITENDISKEPGGRPFFLNKDADFNLSHSGEAVAVSYIRGKNLKVGCDIEQVRSRSKIAKVAEENFSKNENEFIFSCGILNEINFYKIWTLKECYIKLLGLSIFDMKKIPSFIDNGNFSFCADNSKPLSFKVYEIYNGNNIQYILSEAVEGAYLLPEVIWLSSTSLNCKITTEIKN